MAPHVACPFFDLMARKNGAADAFGAGPLLRDSPGASADCRAGPASHGCRGPVRMAAVMIGLVAIAVSLFETTLIRE
jgi:hypothetical protein